MRLETVAESFASYRARVLPPHASAIQVTECQRAFYAGVYCTLLNLMFNIGDDSTSEDDGIVELEKLKAECEAFAASGGMPLSPPSTSHDPPPSTSEHERLFELARQFPDRSIEQMTLLKAGQMLKRIDDAGYEFKLANVVSLQTGEGKLDVVWGGFLGQITPTKAREVAWILLEGASVAESEAGVMRFLKDRLGVSNEHAAAVLNDFRTYRAADPSSLVGQKVDG